MNEGVGGPATRISPVLGCEWPSQWMLANSHHTRSWKAVVFALPILSFPQISHQYLCSFYIYSALVLYLTTRTSNWGRVSRGVTFKIWIMSLHTNRMNCSMKWKSFHLSPRADGFVLISSNFHTQEKIGSYNFTKSVWCLTQTVPNLALFSSLIFQVIVYVTGIVVHYHIFTQNRDNKFELPHI